MQAELVSVLCARGNLYEQVEEYGRSMVDYCEALRMHPGHQKVHLIYFALMEGWPSEDMMGIQQTLTMKRQKNWQERQPINMCMSSEFRVSLPRSKTGGWSVCRYLQACSEPKHMPIAFETPASQYVAEPAMRLPKKKSHEKSAAYHGGGRAMRHTHAQLEGVREESFDEATSVKRLQVVDCLANANELDGHLELVDHAHDGAAARGAVQFRQNKARQRDGVVEFPRLSRHIEPCAHSMLQCHPLTARQVQVYRLLILISQTVAFKVACEAFPIEHRCSIPHVTCYECHGCFLLKAKPHWGWAQVSPVVPSSTSSTSLGALRTFFWMARWHFSSSSMSFQLVCSRPEVSQIATSAFSFKACSANTYPFEKLPSLSTLYS